MGKVSRENQTAVSDFHLLGLSVQPEQQPLLFGIFLGMYLVTIVGNLLIILAIGSDPYLHTPMYFFLANLSLTDACFASASIPKMLANIHTHSWIISYSECLVQIYFLIMFGGLDNFLLAVMAYDRYVAICQPLYYSTAMSPQLCALMLGMSLVLTNLAALVHTLLLTRVTFCSHKAIYHFYCDLRALLKLACSDTHINQLMIITIGLMFLATPLMLIILSYVHISCAVFGISSSAGRWKAFSTCGSHLTVVLLFYGSLMGVYLLPPSTHSADREIRAAILYMMIIPMLNPFIYSLRNRDMKKALSKLLGSNKTFLPRQ
ncbi:olfactory receptor family 1 subfamily N member 2 [Phyllostomus discolor]|uniref:Olfactory receptor n=1 Tax=Phyllostomus discolor TaxID=89673 RepID=A0A6J2N4Q7_9CHIR|nr:olfactory receptor 1N2-like [Phyllostomus discolor]KAF6126206.1 olfactory receptor family 1 subfamily N member 2 [Phyllostomus discolor]